MCPTCEGTGFAEVTVTVYDANGSARKVKDWGS